MAGQQATSLVYSHEIRTKRAFQPAGRLRTRPNLSLSLSLYIYYIPHTHTHNHSKGQQ